MRRWGLDDRGVIHICRNKMGNEGIQRKSQREKFHMKDLFCCHCNMKTRHMEIRHCDWLEKI